MPAALVLAAAISPCVVVPVITFYQLTGISFDEFLPNVVVLGKLMPEGLRHDTHPDLFPARSYGTEFT